MSRRRHLPPVQGRGKVFEERGGALPLLRFYLIVSEIQQKTRTSIGVEQDLCHEQNGTSVTQERLGVVLDGLEQTLAGGRLELGAPRGGSLLAGSGTVLV